MDKFEYRIYGKAKQGGNKYIGKRKTKESAYQLGEALSRRDYWGYIIIENNITHNWDFPLDVKYFSQECKVELVDELKNDIEVKATELKIGDRIKEKGEER